MFHSGLLLGFTQTLFWSLMLHILIWEGNGNKPGSMEWKKQGQQCSNFHKLNTVYESKVNSEPRILLSLIKTIFESLISLTFDGQKFRYSPQDWLPTCHGNLSKCLTLGLCTADTWLSWHGNTFFVLCVDCELFFFTMSAVMSSCIFSVSPS